MCFEKNKKQILLLSCLPIALAEQHYHISPKNNFSQKSLCCLLNHLWYKPKTIKWFFSLILWFRWRKRFGILSLSPSLTLNVLTHPLIIGNIKTNGLITSFKYTMMLTLLVTFCSLLFSLCSMLVIFCSLLVPFYSLRVTFRSKLLWNKITVNRKIMVWL